MQLHSGRFLRRFRDAFVDLLLPPFCALCGPCVPSGSIPFLCSSCTEELVLVSAHIQCTLCGSILTGFENSRGKCLGCFRKRAPWSRLVVLGAYEGLLSELIRRLKFDRERSFASTLGDLMAAQTVSVGWTETSFDAVVVIPLTRARLDERGFNQSALIGSWVAEALSVPVQESWLKRTGKKESQVGHGAKARRKLKSSTFSVAPQVFGKRLLLIDDVVTTQGTIRAAVTALKKGGTIDVKVLCCARTNLPH